MALKDEYNFDDLENEAENMVVEELERQLALEENARVCRTEECVLDMAAYALNHVPPLYRATLLGRVYKPALDEKHYGEVRDAVAEAIRVVRENPPSDLR
ncbi:MAG: competence protein ComFB [Spirochaetes bacterium]|jgi:competence protein ComFB|nr:competence protein ComFB [Spirochaetota bacterium]